MRMESRFRHMTSIGANLHQRVVKLPSSIISTLLKNFKSECFHPNNFNFWKFNVLE